MKLMLAQRKEIIKQFNQSYQLNSLIQEKMKG